MVRITTINGMQVDMDRISNPKLRRVAQERSFMFSYSDQHTDAGFKRSGDHVDFCTKKDSGGGYRDANKDRGSIDHTEHSDKNTHRDVYGDYSERATHTDVSSGSSEHTDNHKHTDYTDHTQKHQEYDDSHSDYFDNALYT